MKNTLNKWLNWTELKLEPNQEESSFLGLICQGETEKVNPKYPTHTKTQSEV